MNLVHDDHNHNHKSESENPLASCFSLADSGFAMPNGTTAMYSVQVVRSFTFFVFTFYVLLSACLWLTQPGTHIHTLHKR